MCIHTNETTSVTECTDKKAMLMIVFYCLLIKINKTYYRHIKYSNGLLTRKISAFYWTENGVSNYNLFWVVREFYRLQYCNKLSVWYHFCY